MNPVSSGYAFDPLQGLVVVQAEVFGRRGSIVLQLALDTGATGTMINVGPLAAVGYDPSLQTERIQVTTGSGVEYAPRISVVRMKAIGHERTNFPILAHTLPPSTSIDGILGLDYLRGARLSIDFRTGFLTLT